MLKRTAHRRLDQLRRTLPGGVQVHYMNTYLSCGASHPPAIARWLYEVKRAVSDPDDACPELATELLAGQLTEDDLRTAMDTLTLMSGICDEAGLT